MATKALQDGPRDAVLNGLSKCVVHLRTACSSSDVLATRSVLPRSFAGDIGAIRAHVANVAFCNDGLPRKSTPVFPWGNNSFVKFEEMQVCGIVIIDGDRVGLSAGTCVHDIEGALGQACQACEPIS